MKSTKDEVGVLKIKIIVRWVRCEEDTTPDRPDVVHVALVCFRWGADMREKIWFSQGKRLTVLPIEIGYLHEIVLSVLDAEFELCQIGRVRLKILPQSTWLHPNQ